MNVYDLFIKNAALVEKGLAFEVGLTRYFCALQCTMQQQLLDIDKVNACKKIIKQNTRAFSAFRSTGHIHIATALSLYNDPERIFQGMDAVFTKLLDRGFSKSTYLSSATIKLQELDDDTLADTIDRAFLIYQDMKDNHSFLTNAGDYGFAIMLAMTDMEISDLTRNAEMCYLDLKEHFSIGNATQSLSHILAISNKFPEDNCQRVMELFHGLEDNGYNYGKNYELTALGALALLDVDTQNIVNDIIEVSNALLGVKGFGDVLLGRKPRLMLAAMLVAGAYAQEYQARVSTGHLTNATLNNAIGMNTAILVAMNAAAVNYNYIN